jgi:hypothetical protein
MNKVVSIKDLRSFQEKAERDLANWPTPVTSNTERAESDDGADSEVGKREADARRAEREALMEELNILISIWLRVMKQWYGSQHNVEDHIESPIR